MTQETPAAPADFATLYQSGFAPLTAQICAYLGDAAEAQDIVQETYLRAWQRWNRICRYDDPLAWLRRVAWNLATSRWRRQALLNRILRQHRVNESVSGIGPEHVALITALRQLPERQRLAIVLHYLADRTIDDIAEDMAAPRGTVLSWLHRGRERLAAQLASEAAPPPVKGTRTHA